MRLFLVAVALPAVIVVVDYWMLELWPRRSWSPTTLVTVYALFVCQVGVLGLTIGRYIEFPLLRWIVFAWAIALIDLQLIRVIELEYGFWNPVSWLTYAFVSAQVGLLAVWGILSTARWPLRLPALISALVIVAYVCASIPGSHHWARPLLWQSGALVALCLAARIRGFRFGPLVQVRTAGPSTPIVERLQFTIGHMLFWALALVPLLELVPRLDVSFFTYWHPWDVRQLSVDLWFGVCLATVSLVGVWASLGTGSARRRFTALVAVAVGMGALLMGIDKLFNELDISGSAPGLSNALPVHGAWWLGWTCLAAGFLGGLLLVFRASGYRLMRGTRESAKEG